MHICSNCGSGLSPVFIRGVRSYHCSNCGARAATFESLRHMADDAQVRKLWAAVQSSEDSGGRACPLCQRPMVQVPLSHGAGALVLDICAHDKLVWFDPAELDSFADTDIEAEERAASQPDTEAGKQAALLKQEAAAEAIRRIQAVREKRAARTGGQGEEPASWRAAMAYLGLPIESAEPVRNRRPYVTWGSTALSAGLGLVGLLGGGALAQQFGLDPADPMRTGGVTLLAHGLLAGGAVQLFLTSYFLMTFGDNVENALGSLRYAGLLIGSILAGGGLHLAWHGSQDVLVGGSAMVTALLTFYALRYPRARIGVLVLFRGMVQIPAWLNLVGWLTVQLLLAYTTRTLITLRLLQLPGLRATSGWMQLGGLAMGFMFWLLWRDNWKIDGANLGARRS